jgi:mannosyltransferase
VSKVALYFCVVVVLTFAWRCAGLTSGSLWLDEGYQSIVDAYGRPLPDLTQVPDRPFIFNPGEPASPSEMLRNFRNVDPLTPPLYQLLLNRWIAGFGGEDFSVRMLSVLISTAGAACLFYAVNRMFGAKAALMAGLVQAFSQFDVYYGQEVRMYALVLLSATLSCGSLIMLLLHFLRGRERVVGWLIYIVSTWALINSHYTGLFLVVFEGMLGVGCALGRRSWRLLGLLIASWLSVGVLWLPWWQMFQQAAAVRKAGFYVARQPKWWWPIYALLLRIPYNWLTMLSGKQVWGWAYPIYGTSAAALFLGFRSLPALERRARLAALMIVGWAVIPAVVLWVSDVMETRNVIEQARYVMFTAPAVYILAGLGFASLKLRSPLAAGLLSLHLLLAAGNNIAHITILPQREPWRDMARTLESVVPPAELVLVAQHYNIVCLDRYLRVPYRQVGVASVMPQEHIDEILRGVDSFALITAQEGEAFTGKVPPRYEKVYERKFIRGLWLRRYAVTTDRAPARP